MSAKKLLIISIDALNAKDLDYIKKLENFKDFFINGSYVKEVTAVYPTLTYCCHSSIITGNYPDVHGVFHNEQVNPDYHLVQDWFWYKDNIKVETLFDLATSNKLTTANVLWPVMASAGKAIKYNVPEIWSDRGVSSTKLFLKHGTYNMLPAVLKYQKLLKGKEQPYLDNFSEAVAINTLKTKRPDLLTLHLTELDTIRHKKGVFSKDVYTVLDKVNERLGHIFDAMKKAKTFDQTNIILLGDHGGNDFDKYILINSLFHKAGLIITDDQGNITDWQAYANSAGGSNQIHLKTPSDSKLYTQVKEILESFTHKDDSPIKQMFTTSDTKVKHHLFGTYSFVLEAKDDYIFGNFIREHSVIPSSDIENTYVCDHGFLPSHRNLKTLLIGKGPDINKGHVIEQCGLVDEGPTFAKLLDLEFMHCHGNIIDGFIKE